MHPQKPGKCFEEHTLCYNPWQVKKVYYKQLSEWTSNSQYSPSQISARMSEEEELAVCVKSRHGQANCINHLVTSGSWVAWRLEKQGRLL